MKNIKGKTRQNYKRKRFMNKLIFLSFIIMLVASTSGCSLARDTSSSNGGKKIDSEENSEPTTKDYYSLGDRVKVGNAIYTLNNVSLTAERNT